MESQHAPGERTIKYQHLNPATYFDCVVRDARSVVLAGGTMSPVRFFLSTTPWHFLTEQVSDMAFQLFPSIARDRLFAFSCGHVIPRTNLRCLVIGTAPRGKGLEFKFKDRDDPSTVSTVPVCGD